MGRVGLVQPVEVDSTGPMSEVTILHAGRRDGSVCSGFHIRPSQFGSAQDSYPVMFSVGGSTGAKNLGKDDGVFFGFGIGLSETIGASAAWNGDNVTLGTAFRPRTLDNVSIAVALEDAFDEDGIQRLSFSVSWFGRDIFRR